MIGHNCKSRVVKKTFNRSKNCDSSDSNEPLIIHHDKGFLHFHCLGALMNTNSLLLSIVWKLLQVLTPSRIHSLIESTISVLFTLSLFVVYLICSSPLSLQSSPSNLQKFLLQNGYPVGIINYNINYVLRIQQRQTELSRTVPKKTVRKVLPYLGVQSELITTQL